MDADHSKHDEKADTPLGARIERSLEQAMAALEKGGGIAGAMGINEDQCEAIYALGHRRYVREDYKGAEEIFGWLAGIRGVDARALKALGAARKMQQKNADALDAYALAALADIKDPEPSFYAAECLFRMGEMKRARHALSAARQQAEILGDHESMIQRIDEMLSHIPEMSQDISLESLMEEREKQEEQGEEHG